MSKLNLERYLKLLAMEHHRMLDVLLGIDRLIMLMEHEDNIRDVIAFPKNKKARDVMMNAPSKVFEKQLEEVHIKIEE